MKYLFLDGENFGFKDSSINEILTTDIKISDEIYNQFFELQSQEKQLRIKNINGLTFNDIFEEYAPVEIQRPKTELEILKETVDTLVLSML